MTELEALRAELKRRADFWLLCLPAGVPLTDEQRDEWELLQEPKEMLIWQAQNP